MRLSRRTFLSASKIKFEFYKFVSPRTKFPLSYKYSRGKSDCRTIIPACKTIPHSTLGMSRSVNKNNDASSKFYIIRLNKRQVRRNANTVLRRSSPAALPRPSILLSLSLAFFSFLCLLHHRLLRPYAERAGPHRTCQPVALTLETRRRSRLLK